MKDKLARYASLFLLLLAVSLLKPQGQAGADEPAESVVHITILHFNDVYEITPVAGGTRGGLARVTTLKKQFLAENPNTLALFGGDLYFPSGLGTAIVDGELLAGKQAVAVMNTVGVDYMVFGDHEFDIAEKLFLDRLAETKFPILSGNVFDAVGKPFPGTVTNEVVEFKNQRGDSVKLGLCSVTEPLPNAKFNVTYVEASESLNEQVAALKDKVDILIGLTHFTVSFDKEFAKSHPEIDLIFGGDDHEAMKEEAGEGLATIYKADSNARSVYRVDLYYDAATKKMRVTDKLIEVTDQIALDRESQAVSDFWVKKAFDAFRTNGIEAEKVIATPTVELDGYGSSVRNHATALTDVIGAGMAAADDEAEAAIYMSGFIRFDDSSPANSPFTYYDAIRCLPFNDPTFIIELDGDTLRSLLKSGDQSKATGEYLLKHNISGADNDWSIGGAPLDAEKKYVIAVNNRLFRQYEAVVKDKHKVVRPSITLQEALILGLQKTYPPREGSIDQPGEQQVGPKNVSVRSRYCPPRSPRRWRSRR